jgi:NADH-quinone oxidoreductase subunit H
VGPYGLFQTVADAAKLLSKEDIKPDTADTLAYVISPVLAVFGVLLSVAVIPFAPGLIGTDLNIGVLYLVALGSIGIMSALMAGWSSNNKYALLSGFRVVAQLLSYEVPMVLAMLPPVLITGTMRMGLIAEAQSLQLGPVNLGLGWFVFMMPAVALIYFISALAESEMTPFDLLEAESELIAGFHIEYSGMKFAMYFLAQFLNAFFLGAIAVTLFLGGWQGPFADVVPGLGLIYFFAKAFLVYVLIQWVRGTFPRLRVDQMMSLAWKVMVPMVLALILLQMVIMKLDFHPAVIYLLILASNVVALLWVSRVLGKYVVSEQMRTKRAFEPTTLIGTMAPVNSPAAGN